MFTYFLFADKTSLNSKGIGTTVLSILFILVFLSASFLAAYEGVQPTVILRKRIAFYSVFFEYPPKWCTYSAGMAGAT